MPHANIWIREEDWPTWQSITDRPDWLHERLANFAAHSNPAIGSKLRVVSDEKELAEITFGKKDIKFCKHGSAIGLCKFGCK